MTTPAKMRPAFKARRAAHQPDPSGHHVHVQVFAGKDQDHLQGAGEIVLHGDEVDDFVMLLATARRDPRSEEEIQALVEDWMNKPVPDRLGPLHGYMGWTPDEAVSYLEDGSIP